MKVCSLFSGGGLGDYGLELAGMETVFQCEINDYCQKILKLRWPNVPKWNDIKTLKPEIIPTCDLVAGGFPCQPFSSAGKHKGKEDDRYLWPEMLRIIKQIKPSYILAENVPGIVGTVLDEMLDDLEAENYSTFPIVFPAHALGTPHERKRVWIIAHPNGKRLKILQGKHTTPKASGRKKPSTNRWWNTESRVGRMDDGTPNRVDRLKMLGNGQVVQVVEWIGKRIMDFEKTKGG